MDERKGNVPSGVGDGDHQPPPLYHQYGTFQGVAHYSQAPPPHPVVGFPQPAPPPCTVPYHNPYPHGYQSVPGYAVAEGTPVRLPRLPCCGLGVGWFLFIAGFFFASIPWYIGALILFCVRVDYREKPGLVACLIGSILASIAIIFGASAEGHHRWHLEG